MEYLVAILTILAGTILLFAGRTLYNKLLFLLGFLAGAVIGAIIAFTISPVIIFVVLGAFAGAIFGAMLFKFANFSIFIVIGGLAGYFFARLIIPPSIVQFLYYLAIASFIVIGIVIAVLFKKSAIIAATSLIGAVLTISGIEQLISIFSIDKIIGAGTFNIQRIVFVIILAIIGAVVQLISTRKQRRK